MNSSSRATDTVLTVPTGPAGAEQSLLCRWSRSDALACEAECSLFNARVSAISGRGPRPTQREVLRAALLRKRAQRLFEAATLHFASVTASPPAPHP
jgi:hypothetical protein